MVDHATVHDISMGRPVLASTQNLLHTAPACGNSKDCPIQQCLRIKVVALHGTLGIDPMRCLIHLVTNGASVTTAPRYLTQLKGVADLMLDSALQQFPSLVKGGLRDIASTHDQYWVLARSTVAATFAMLQECCYRHATSTCTARGPSSLPETTWD